MISPTTPLSSPPYPAVAPAVPPPAGERLRIVYDNDAHEHWEGMARSVTAFDVFTRQAQANGEDVLRLTAGDDNTGPEPQEFAVGVMLNNLKGVQATTPGNHEYDMNPAYYAQTLSQLANYPTLSANQVLPPTSALLPLQASGKFSVNGRIVPTASGQPVGVIGVTLPEVSHIINKNVPRDGTDSLDLDGSIQAVQAQADALRQQGVTRAVVVSHLGYEKDQQLAQRLRGVDVIVGGHTHTKVNGIYPQRNLLRGADGQPVLLLQAGSFGRQVGVADLAFTPAGVLNPEQSQNQLYSTAQFAPSPAAVQVMNQYLPPARPVANLAAGYSADNMHTGPNPVAQFAADSLRDACQADIGLVRAAEIRGDMPAGLFTSRDLAQAMPFADQVVRLRLTGEQLLGALRRAAQGLTTSDDHHNQLLHPSGLAYTADKTTGALVNAQVFNQQTGRWAPIDPQQTYTVALCEYAVQNPEENPELAHPDQVEGATGKTLAEVFHWGLQQAALRQTGSLQGAIQLLAVDGRLTVV
ncbi:MAG: bifunctional UDP-sugar hydrolase/5'-nucleotidase [Candidatus Melainabacteria bacterium]